MKALNPALALFNNDLMNRLDKVDMHNKYACLSSAGLVIGSGDTKKVKIANTVTFLANGVFKSKSSAEVAFTATTHNIPANAGAIQECQYFICLDASGNITIVAGTIANGGLSLMPDIPLNLCVIGVVKIAVAAGATPFAANSDALSAGHLTVTYTNLGYVSSRFDSAL